MSGRFGHGRAHVIGQIARAIVLIGAALFTAAVWLLAASAFLSDAVTLPVRIVLAAAAAVAFLRPRDGLLVVAGLAPFAQIGARLFSTGFRGAEAVVLACLAGALLRAWRSGRLRRFPEGGVETAACLFGAVVAASCLEQLWYLQLQRDFPSAFFALLTRYATHGYLSSLGGLGMVFNAMLLLEGLALLIWTAWSCRSDPGLPRRLVAMLVVAAAAASAQNVVYALERFVASGFPSTWWWPFVIRQRWSVHVGDVNAAASFFGLTAVIAAGMGAAEPARRWQWLAGAAIIGAGLLLTGSRTAAAAVLIALAGAGVIALLSRSWRRSPTTLVLLALGGAFVLAWAAMTWYTTPYRQAGRALAIRWMFLETTAGMLEAHPLFGVGIGQYELWSQHFAPPELRAIYRLENAHNNFAQVAGELGLAGLTTFVGLFGAVLLGWARHRPVDPVARASLPGMAAFIATWLGGHPLLVPAVAYPFWLVLGVIAASTAGRPWTSAVAVRPLPSGTWRTSVVAAAVVVLALAGSVPSRVGQRTDTLDWSRITYGLLGWERGPRGERYQWTSGRARLHVPAGTIRVSLPVRGHRTARDRPLDVEVSVNGRPAWRERIDDSSWRTIGLVLPPIEASHHRIDVRVEPTWVPAEVIDGSTDTRRLGIQIGELVSESAP